MYFCCKSYHNLGAPNSPQSNFSPNFYSLVTASKDIMDLWVCLAFFQGRWVGVLAVSGIFFESTHSLDYGYYCWTFTFTGILADSLKEILCYVTVLRIFYISIYQYLCNCFTEIIILSNKNSPLQTFKSYLLLGKPRTVLNRMFPSPSDKAVLPLHRWINHLFPLLGINWNFAAACLVLISFNIFTF